MAIENQVVAVVVTFNRKELLKKCLFQVLHQKEMSSDIFVIDNASTVGMEEMIATVFADERTKFFSAGTNFGGAGGNGSGQQEICA